ncbi:hypothetical protein ACVWYG_001169 [Pedobacter sp. UYEF25]
MPFVIDQLTFKANRVCTVVTSKHQKTRALLTFLKKVRNFPIATGLNIPFKNKIKVGEHFIGYQIAAATAWSTISFMIFETAVLYRPSAIWLFGLIEAVPASERFSIKKQFPSYFFFRSCQCVYILDLPRKHFKS